MINFREWVELRESKKDKKAVKKSSSKKDGKSTIDKRGDKGLKNNVFLRGLSHSHHNHHDNKDDEKDDTGFGFDKHKDGPSDVDTASEIDAGGDDIGSVDMGGDAGGGGGDGGGGE